MLPPETVPIPRGVVILATDTGVGKTFIGCALTQALRAKGFMTRVRKPVETGCEVINGELIPADATLLWSAAGKLETLDTVCPLRFTLPVAAPQAAANAGARLHFTHDIAPTLPTATTYSRSDPSDFWIIESAGGALSPLAGDALNCDLASFTQLPAILIAPDRLGTLSTLFAHIEALSRRSITIAALVLNQRPPQMDADNIQALKQWLPELLPQAHTASLPPILSFAQGAAQGTVGTRLRDAILQP